MRHGYNELYRSVRHPEASRRVAEKTKAVNGKRVPGAFLTVPELADHGLSFPANGKTETIAALEDIAASMTSIHDAPPSDGEHSVPAGYTYFGQFFMHDMVFSRLGGPSPRTGAIQARNMMTLGLDLDPVYGNLPGFSPHLYEATPSSLNGRVQRCKFLVGLTRDERGNPLSGSNDPRDVPRIAQNGPFMLAAGPPRSNQPIIHDSRNDDHLIISQLHANFLQIHNRCVDLETKTGRRAEEAFNIARRFLVTYYRGAIVHDYLEKLLLPAVHHLLLAPGSNGFLGSTNGPESGLPIDFSAGAARFGHAMARNEYRLNRFFGAPGSLHGPAEIGGILAQSSDFGGADLPPKVPWFVEWQHFFALDPRSPPQPARRITPLLTTELASTQRVDELEGKPRSIAFADLWRCYQLRIPSGQEYARHIKTKAEKLGLAGLAKYEVLAGTAMLPSQACWQQHGLAAEKLEEALRRHPEFLERTPLSYYVAQEASVYGDNGVRLGPVGSFLLAATVKSALAAARGSGDRWPEIKFLPKTTIAELISFADPSRVATGVLADKMAAIAWRKPAGGLGRSRRTAL